MKYLIWISLFFLMKSSTTIFDFTKARNTDGWRVVDDTVMGGRSDGSFYHSKANTAIFEGEVSLENNGGFSSVRYTFDPIEIKDSQYIKIRLKGDGNRYQFRVKHQNSDYHSYISYFQTDGEWQDIKIPLEELKPVFRGRDLNMSDFNKNTISQIGFLIGNKKAQKFRLEIKYIEMK